MEKGVIVINGLIFTEGKILLCKKRDFWILPGGKFEVKKDKTELDSLKRELEEELGVKNPILLVTTKREYYGLKTIRGKNIEKVILYKVLIDEKFNPRNEIVQAKYFSKKQLLKLNLSDATRQILKSVEF